MTRMSVIICEFRTHMYAYAYALQKIGRKVTKKNPNLQMFFHIFVEIMKKSVVFCLNAGARREKFCGKTAKKDGEKGRKSSGESMLSGDENI